jgi:phospholipase/carboxylesterase
MPNEPTIRRFGPLTVRVREPDGSGPHPVLLLIHGWTGDENSMWVFSNRLPQDHILIAPRGQHVSPHGGYSWYPDRDGRWPSIEELRPAAGLLFELLEPRFFPSADLARVRLAGFSQGAALSYTLALLQPGRVISLAGLSGFVPEGAQELARKRPLEGMPVFVAHGTLDETVPVERARQGIETLEQAGAEVTYCEDEVGHKLSAACFRGLEKFFQLY